MKKTTLALAALFVAGLTFTSCKKDYTCECKSGSDTFNYEYKNVKKKDAQDACASTSALWSIGGGSCSLK